MERSTPSIAATFASHCAVLLTLAGCGHTEAAGEPATTPAAAEAAPASAAPAATSEAPDRAQHMQATFWMAMDARNALIDGDLERAKRYADELAKQDYAAELPEDWKHWTGEMQKQAGEIAVAGDVASASRALGALALSCGSCHFEKRGGPAVDPVKDTNLDDASGDSLENRMYRHELAADELWLGLVKPSEKLWERGTVTLTRAALEPPSKQGEEVDPQLAAEVESIRAIAKAARAARTHQERAAHYGELVAHCGACHLKSAR